jgi:hypothetical protein
MTKVINYGFTDTPISGVTGPLVFNRDVLNFQKDFRVKTNNPGKEVVLTNITSPVDRPENIRLAYQEIANIYSGTGIEPSVLAPTKKGVSILAQVTEVLSILDDADASYRVDEPASAHLVLKLAQNELITPAVVERLIGRLLSSLYDSGLLTQDRLKAILRGSLVPAGL